MITSGSSSEARVPKQVELQFAELRQRLEEAEQTLEAIRSGEVDALVVYDDEGEKVFTLKGADEPYRVFVEHMQEGALTVDQSGLILYCNQRMADMVGRSLEKVIGSQADELVREDLRPQLRALRDHGHELPPRAELVLKGNHGEVPVLVSIAPLGNDAIDGFALTMTDLTFQKQHEAALRAANEELEGFCYSVSHDLRTPLRAMITSSRILVEDFGSKLPQEAEERLKRIESSAKNLAQLIDDLLSFARLGRLHIDAKEVDLTSLAEGVVQEFSPSAQGWFMIQPGLKTTGDASLLRMVIQNLFSNAVKFSQQRQEPKIEFGFCEKRSAFFVRDNGIGFEQAYAQRIFNPFERLHSSEHFPGTGIGLANVQRIVTRHGGQIWATSEPGQGATFSFTFAI